MNTSNTLEQSSQHSGLYSIDLSKPFLVGRDWHQQKLLDRYAKVCNNQSDCEVALVYGKSGTGKSALITETLKESTEAVGFFYASGKFDQLKGTAQPFSAFVEAITELCGKILLNKVGDERLVLLQEIKNSLKGDVSTLAGMVPRVAELNLHSAGAETTNNENPSEKPHKSQHQILHPSVFSSERAIHVFKSFITAICQPYCPVVLVLDDLHNADDHSLELFKSLALDSKISGLYLVGAYRENEMQDSLTRCMNTIEESIPFSSTSIQLTNLVTEDVNKLISHTLELRLERTLPLAEVVFKKTEGNCFFVVQFMIYLQLRGYLYYDIGFFEWRWDTEHIQAKTEVSENVAELVLDRIQMLPTTAQRVLMTAAFLGSNFDSLFVGRLIHHEENRLGKRETLSWELMIHKPLDGMGGFGITGGNEAYKRLGAFRSASVACLESTSLQEVQEEVDRQLELIVDFGLLQKGLDQWYRFRHDRIQQAAYGLVGQGKRRDSKHLRIGRLLRRIIIEEHTENWVFFAAVDHLNLGCLQMEGDEEKLELARLNLKAAEKAMETAAIFPAASYAYMGLTMLDLSNLGTATMPKNNNFRQKRNARPSFIKYPRDLTLGLHTSISPQQKLRKWQVHYELTLGLANIAADMAYCAGKFQLCLETTEEVLKHARSLKDKIRAYLTRIDLSGSQGRLNAAVNEGRTVLDLLGEQFPQAPNPINIQVAWMKTKRIIKGKSIQELESLPNMTDPTKLNIMRVLTLVASYADFDKGGALSQLAWLMFLRMMQISVKHGFSPYSIVAFAAFGVILCDVEDITAGAEYGTLALRLLDKCDLTDVAAKVKLIVYSSLTHWSTPLANTLEPLVQSYRVGMATGEVEDALLSSMVYSYHYFCSGLPLTPLQNDLREYTKLMKEYRQDICHETSMPLWQLVLNLMGRSDDPVILNGEAMTEDKFEAQIKESGNSIALRNYLCARLQLAFMFGRLDQQRARLNELIAFKQTHKTKATFNYCDQTFFEALTALDLLKRTNDRQYRVLAKKAISRLKSWIGAGAVNCQGMLLLVQAEDTSTTKKANDDKVRAFELAVTTFQRQGELRLGAIACERAGKFLFQLGMSSKAEFFISRARDLYTEWGAQAMADNLVSKHHFLAHVSSSSHQTVSSGRTRTNFRGRARFHKTSAEQHKALVLSQLRVPYLPSPK